MLVKGEEGRGGGCGKAGNTVCKRLRLNVKLVFMTILSGFLLMVCSSFTADRVSSQPVAKRTVAERKIKVRRGAGTFLNVINPRFRPTNSL
jgi:hypothetical protein